MSYRLPARSVTACSSAGCDASASYSDAEPGERAEALAGWRLGPGTAICPSHPPRPSVLHFAA